MLMQLRDRKICGFTLIELMVAVAIVGILAAIAIPSYKNSIRKSKRQVAISDMLLYAQAQERYRTNNTTYSNSISTFTDSSGTNKIYYVNAASSSSDYTFSVTGTTSAYTISATPIGSQNKGFEQTYCNPMQLTQANARTPVTCWAR